MTLTREQFESLKRSGLTTDQIVKFESGQTPKQDEVKLSVAQKLGNILVGAGKGALSTVKGLSNISEKTLGRVVGAYSGGETSAEKLQNQAEQKLNLSQGNLTEATNTYQKIGKFGEQVAEFAIPITKVSKATKALSSIEKILARAVTSGAVATGQSGKVGKETAIASGLEVALPGVGKVVKPVTNVVKRLFAGLGSGLSGVPVEQLNVIAQNPNVARQISQVIKKEGQETVLEQNAKAILDGVAKIRQEARSAYGKGIEVLSKTDIKPSVIRTNVLDVLNKNGIKVLKDGINLNKSEILNKSIQNRAKDIITELNSKIPASGKGLRAFLDKLEASKFKSALDPDRQAFNNLMNDLYSGIRKSIGESTNKLESINKNYSQEMSLVQGIESIFGKVKFKNTTELNKVAKKLEGLFSQKGLDPQTVDSFLTRIGITPSEFKTGEAVRGIVSKTSSANTKGLSFAEILQQVTSSVVTPEAIKNIAIATGISTKVLESIIKNTAPSARGAIIKGIVGETK